MNEKADLDQWDPIFWAGLKTQIEAARAASILVHVSIFDGVHFRNGPSNRCLSKRDAGQSSQPH